MSHFTYSDELDPRLNILPARVLAVSLDVGEDALQEQPAPAELSPAHRFVRIQAEQRWRRGIRLEDTKRKQAMQQAYEEMEEAGRIRARERDELDRRAAERTRIEEALLNQVDAVEFSAPRSSFRLFKRSPEGPRVSKVDLKQADVRLKQQRLTWREACQAHREARDHAEKMRLAYTSAHARLEALERGDLDFESERQQIQEQEREQRYNPISGGPLYRNVLEMEADLQTIAA